MPSDSTLPTDATESFPAGTTACTAPAELFAGTDPCHATLPAAEVLDSVQFEQFLPLDVAYGDVQVPAVLTFAGEHTHVALVEKYVRLFERLGLRVPSRFVELIGGLSLVPGQNPPDDPVGHPIARTAIVDDVGALLQASAGSGLLTPAGAAALSSGIPAYVVRGDEVLELVPRGGAAAVEVDAASFAREPGYVDAQGRLQPLRLAPAQVADLVQGRATRIDLPGSRNGPVEARPRDGGLAAALGTRSPDASRAVAPRAAARALAPPSSALLLGGDGGPRPTLAPLRPIVIARLPNPVASLPLALYLPYRQEWRLRGYQRGRLVNALSLAPQEEQTIEIFSWDRRRSETESAMSTELERSTESSGTRRDSADVASEISRDVAFEAKTGGKVGFQVGIVKVDLSSDLSARTGLNDQEKRTRSAIVDATEQAATRVRDARTFKVTESRERGSETRVTRKLRNPNASRTLDVRFFETLAAYEVSVRPVADAIRLVALVPADRISKVKEFTAQEVRDHETALRLALLDRALEPGIDAARLLFARQETCRLLQETCGELARDAATTDPTWPDLAAAAAQVIQAACDLATPALFPLSVTLPVTSFAQKDIKRYLAQTYMRTKLAGVLPALTALNASSVMPEVAAAVATAVGALTQDQLGGLHSDDDTAHAVERDVFAVFMALPPNEPIAALISTIAVVAAVGFDAFDDAGLAGSIATFQAALKVWRDAAAARAEEEQRAAELRRVAADERQQRLRDLFPPRDVAEATERLDALLRHLNASANIDHYRFAVWAERGPMLDVTLLAWARSGFLEAAPIGFVGDQLAVPVRLDTNRALAGFLERTLGDLRLTAPSSVSTTCFSLPTPALNATATIGCCSALEPTAERATELALDRSEVDIALSDAELRRRNARLDATPPLLDGEAVAAPVLRVVLEGAATPETARPAPAP